MTVQVKPAEGGVMLELSSDDVLVAREYVPTIGEFTVGELIEALQSAEEQSWVSSYQ